MRRQEPRLRQLLRRRRDRDGEEHPRHAELPRAQIQSRMTPRASSVNSMSPIASLLSRLFPVFGSYAAAWSVRVLAILIYRGLDR